MAKKKTLWEDRKWPTVEFKWFQSFGVEPGKDAEQVAGWRPY